MTIEKISIAKKMKKIIFLLSLCLPIVVFAVAKQSFTFSEIFYGTYSVDETYTSAWLDTSARRFILPRDWRVNEVPQLTINDYACDPKALQNQYSVKDITRNVSCTVTPAGIALFGFFRNDSGNYIGRIYLIANNAKQLISSDDLFIDSSRGNFVIGMRSDKSAFVIYSASKTRFFLYSSGNWQEIFNAELSAFSPGYQERIAWSGTAWVFSNLGNNLWLFDGKMLTNISGQIPTATFSLQELVTNPNGQGMILFSDKAGVAAVDNGYQASAIIESRTKNGPYNNAIVDGIVSGQAMIPPNTTIRYFLSNNEGGRWYEATNGLTQFGDVDNRLRWQALLASTDTTSTPTLNGLTLTYSSKDILSSNRSSRDAARVSDIKTARGYIQDYYASLKKDPVITASSQKRDNWNQLKQSLLAWAGSRGVPLSTRSSIENYFPKEPDDEDKFLYDYRSASFGDSYLLYVTLEDKTNERLQNDLDGIVLGVDCADPVFCLGEGPATKNESVSRGLEVKFTPPARSSGTLVRALNDYRVYVIENGQKRWIVNPEVFNNHHFKWYQIELISKEELDLYPTGASLTR